MKNKSARVVSPGEGRALRAFGDEIVIHLDGQDTDGTLTMWTGTLPRDGGPPPHYHLNEDEAFRVLEGQVAFLVNGEWREVGPGGSAFMPRGVVHTFKNVGDRPSQVLIMTTLGV
jgi:quercetin dioxygenase-like cupin family protein